MGSFYGQVLYEFKKLFSSLKITKSNAAEEAIDPIANSQDERVEALTPWDELNIKPSNRWIQLDTDQNTKTIAIGHSTPGEKDDSKTVIGFSKIAENTSPDEEKPDDFIALKYGDFIETTNSNYDKAGHSIASTKTYFQLPISDTEENLEQVKMDIDHIFTNFFTINQEAAEAGKGIHLDTYLDGQDYIKKDRLLDELDAFLTHPDHPYAKEALTGVLKDMYPDAQDMGTETPNIAQTIGVVTGSEGFSTILNEKLNTDKIYTVSEAIQGLMTLNETLIQEQSNLKSANTALLAMIEGLLNRIEALEEKIPTE